MTFSLDFFPSSIAAVSHQIPSVQSSQLNFYLICLEKATLFKSALMPAKFTFKTTDEKEYIVSEIFSGLCAEPGRYLG